MSKLFSQITKMTSHLGVTVDRPYFTHAGRIYYYTHDPPHLLKSVQNNLFKYTTFFGDQKAAKWFDITHFYETDQKQRFRLTPKLTSCHVGLPAFSKMKVKLAAQVISRTVAAALETHSHVGSGASEMAEFSMQFNDLFDCMNSSRLRDANRLKWPLSVKGTCDQTKFLNACFNWLTTICVQTDSGKYVTNEVKCFADGSCPVSIAALVKFDSELRGSSTRSTLINVETQGSPSSQSVDSDVEPSPASSLGAIRQRYLRRIKRLNITNKYLQESLANTEESARQPWYIVRKSPNRSPFRIAQQYQRNLYIVEKYFQCATIPLLTLWVYLHSFSRCSCSNMPTIAKFRENLNVQQFKVIQGR